MKKCYLFCLILIIGCVFVATGTAQNNISPPASGWYFVKSVQSGTTDAGYWDQPGKPTRYDKGANLMVYALDTVFNNDQQFHLIPAGNNFYYIQSKNGGFVDVAKGERKNGTNVLIWEGTKRNNQKFRFEYLGNGRWKIYAATGGIVCLAGRSHANKSNIHIWQDHSGAFTEWYLVDASTRNIWAPQDNNSGKPTPVVIGTKLSAIDYDASGKAMSVEPGVTDVEIWVYDSSNTEEPYTMDGTVKTDVTGKFTLPGKYTDKSSILLMARKNGRSTAVAKIHPKSKQLDTPHFITVKYSDANHVLLPTKYRGDQWYRKQDGYFYLENGIVTDKSDFFYYQITTRNSTINRFLTEAFKNIDYDKAESDQEIIEKMNSVFAFTGYKTKSSMGTDDPLIKEASDFLFRNCRKTSTSPVTRWPSLEEYAETWIKYGFIPVGNCTSSSQMTSTFMYAVGVPADRLCVIKFNYDPSWLVEHWVLGVNMNNRWYAIEPQHAQHYRFLEPNSLNIIKWDRFFQPTYDYTKPFEIWVVAGSQLKNVPFTGDPAELDTIMAERNKPLFFIKNPKLVYQTGGLAFSGKGTAKVVKIEGNSAQVEITAVMKEEGPNGFEEKTKTWTIKITAQGDEYTYVPDPNYIYKGTLSADGKSLTLSGEQSAMTFSIP